MKKESPVFSLRICRTRRPAGLSAAVLVLLVSHAALAQRKDGGSLSAAPNPVRSSMMMMPSVAPLFIEGGGFSSTLHLVNETTSMIRAKVDVYSLQGIRVAGKTLPVAANGLELVSIRDVLNASAANLDVGSVRITSDPEGDGLAAAVAFTHLGRDENYFEEEMPMPTMQGSTVLRGVADDGETAIVAISSLSSEVQNISVSCLLEGQAPRSRVAELRPNQTLLARPCVAEINNPIITGADIEREYQTIHDAKRTATAAAVSITTDGMPGELAAYGIVPHRTRGDQFYTALNFTDPKLKRSSGFVYAGVPVGASELLSEGDYKPEVAVANFGSKTASLTIESAVTIGGKPEKQLLGTVSLGVGEVKTISLSGMRQTPDLRASVMIKTNVAPGDVITKLLSRGDSRLRAVELLDKEISNGENGGGHPWSIAAGNTSILLLFNHDPKEHWFNVRFGGGPGKEPWMKRYKLASMETLGININQLIAGQEIDDKGHKLLIEGQTGEVGWQADGSGAAGRVLQANPMTGMARNFSCSNYYTECGVSDTPNPFLLALGSPGSMSGTNQWNLYHNGPSSSCTCGSTAYANLTLNYQWSSANSSIANITSGASSASSQWQGAGGGNTSASFYETGPYGLYCQAPTAPINVATVGCSPANPLRGSQVTCSLQGAPSASNWQFSSTTGHGSLSSSTGTTTTSWSGVLVDSGTVSVTATNSSGSTTVSTSINISPRNWAISPYAATQVPNGDTTVGTLPVPPTSSGTDSGLGRFTVLTGDSGISTTTVTSGPNQGYAFVSANLNVSSGYFHYIINPDLANSGSVFSQHQYGACGYISQSNLSTQTVRHEAGSTSSHYAEYTASLSSNNPGSYIEAQLSGPSQNPNSVFSSARTQLNSMYSSIGTAASSENIPPVNYNQSNSFLGNINYLSNGQYAPCP